MVCDFWLAVLISLNVSMIGGGVTVGGGIKKYVLFLRQLLTLFITVDEENVDFTSQNIWDSCCRTILFFFPLFLIVPLYFSPHPIFLTLYMSFLKVSLVRLSYLHSLSFFFLLLSLFVFLFPLVTWLF